MLAAEDLRHQIPSAEALGRNLLKRRIPHIYTRDEITALMEAAAQLKPSDTIRPLMYDTLFGLLAATGMRISEALALRLEDVTADGLVIGQTGPAFTICGTHSPCAPSSNASTITRPSAAISSPAMPTSLTPTGICRQRRS